MTTLPVASLQFLVWSPDPALFAAAVVEGSFIDAELRSLEGIVRDEAEKDELRFVYGDPNRNRIFWALNGLTHSLHELRWERRAFGGKDDYWAISILRDRKRRIQRDVAEAAEGFSRAFARFAPREEALQRVAATFNPTPVFDAGDFLERWFFCLDGNDVGDAHDMGRVRRELRQLQGKERAQVRAEAERIAEKNWSHYYRFVIEEIDRLEIAPAGQAA